MKRSYIRKKRKKPNKLRAFKRRLGELWAQKIKERDKMTCQWCKKKIQSKHGAHAHHIVPRSLSNHYGHYELLNGVLLDFRCHIFRIVAEPEEYCKFREAYLTEKDWKYQDLKKLYSTVVKLKLEDYEYLERKLKGEE